MGFLLVDNQVVHVVGIRCGWEEKQIGHCIALFDQPQLIAAFRMGPIMPIVQ